MATETPNVMPVSGTWEYDEFGLFHENAAEFGLPLTRPPTVRREFVEVEPDRRLSALVWGTAAPDLVLLHGGAQNAHTWDTVAMAMDRPLVAIDLPGHGHSDGPGDRPDGVLSVEGNAGDVAIAMRDLAPRAGAVVGMSLGGLTAIALAARAPELVRALVLVDITPGVSGEKSKAISDFVRGPATFPSFDEMLAYSIEHNPTRSISSLRRGILHNAIELYDGSWVWRYRRHGERGIVDGPAAPFDRFGELWEVLGAVRVPVLLVRGMRPQSVVHDDDEAELLRRLPSAEVAHVEHAGHSVQGDTPVELAVLLDDFLQRARRGERERRNWAQTGGGTEDADPL
jgi:pimeloyl-ACP methyl ester carboxylesterase